MNNQFDDQPFEDPKLSALYRRGATEEPDSAMDETILRMAKKGQKRQRRNRMLFGVPLSAAAMVLVAVGIVRLVMQEAPLTEQDLEEALAPAESEPVAEIAPASKQAVKAKARQPVMEEAKEADDREMMDAAPAGLLQDAPKLQISPAAPTGASRPYRMMKPAPAKRAMTRKKEAIEGEQLATDPEKLLSEIRKLVAANQLEAARNRLVEFRQQYPEYPVPKELEALLLKGK